MATTVKIRRSGTATATPSSLEHGEIAINYADGKVFWKDASNVIASFTFQSYALASHTHAASDITSGTLDSARLDATLAALAGVTTSADEVIYATGSDTFATTALSSFGRSLIDDADAAAARTTLGVQPTASPAFTGAATFAGAVTITDSLTNGQLLVNDNANDTQNRFGTLGVSHYTLAEEPLLCIAGSSQAANNFVYIGGAFSQYNAATNILFYTAAANTTVSGTLRLTISSTAATFAVPVLVTAGSVSACSVAASGDPNTGLYFPSADVAAIVTNGTERVRVKATGSVRFVPLSADPASGNEAGDVYYNSSTNKLRVYNGTSWVDLH